MALTHRLLLGLFALAFGVAVVSVTTADDEERVARLTGSVVDEGGRPIEGATVYLGLYVGGNRTETDRDGRFGLDVVGSDVAPLRVWSNGYRDRQVELPADTKNAKIVLERGVSISGRVVAPDGLALPPTLEVVSDGVGDRRCVAAIAESGRFQASGFAPETRRRRVGVLVSGFSSETMLRRVDGARLDLDEVRLRPARALDVTVVDAQERPLPGVRVRVGNASWSTLEWHGVSDAEGRAHFTHVDRGALRITAQREGARAPMFHASVPPSDERTSEVRVRVLLDRQLTGTLEWTGAGVCPWAGDGPVDVLVQAFEGDEQRYTWFGRTAGEGSGRFEVDRAVPGTWRLTISVALRGSPEVELPSVTIPREPEDTPFDLGVVLIER